MTQWQRLVGELILLHQFEPQDEITLKEIERTLRSIMPGNYTLTWTTTHQLMREHLMRERLWDYITIHFDNEQERTLFHLRYS